MANKVLPRSEIDKKYKWNAESVFPSNEAWEKEVAEIVKDVEKIKQYQRSLAEGPSVLLDTLNVVENLIARAQIAFMYAGFSYNVDTTDQKAAGMFGKAQGMVGQVASAVSFIDPEILAIGKKKLDQWITENPKLAVHRHSFDNLFRKQAHVRSAEVEELLGLASDPLSGASNSTSMLTNADFKFKSVKDDKDKVIDITQGNFDTQLMSHRSRKVRKALRCV